MAALASVIALLGALFIFLGVGGALDDTVTGGEMVGALLGVALLGLGARIGKNADWSQKY